MKNLAIVTSTRAEYGILKPLILKLNDFSDLKIDLIVTGTHLCDEFGLTVSQIIDDGMVINEEIKIFMGADSPNQIVNTMSVALSSFSDFFKKNHCDALIVLGDRYEILSIVFSAFIHRVPIIHLHGGEITIGALDDSIRHSITKLSNLHLTSTEEYKKRVIQLGENPTRVFNIGSIGVENIKNVELFKREEVYHFLDIPISKKFVLVTFHPETISGNNESKVITLLDACVHFEKIFFVFTKSNADLEGVGINKIIKDYSMRFENISLFSSLGSRKYFSAVKYCIFVLGNSSSGVIEVPSLGTPVINLGDRQKGRIMSKSIMNIKLNLDDIIAGIDFLSSERYEEFIYPNPYDKGNSIEQACKIIREFVNSKNTNKCHFYDIPYIK